MVGQVLNMRGIDRDVAQRRKIPQYFHGSRPAEEMALLRIPVSIDALMRASYADAGMEKAGILELSCETDFVARNQDFVELGKKIVREMVDSGTPATDPSFAQMVQEAITTIKENMAIRRGQVMEIGDGELVSDYIHGESGRIGVLAKIKAEKPELLANDAVKSFAFDVALHVAAFRPTFLSVDTADPTYVSQQEEIFAAQAKALDKPENVTKGIAAGKLKKHLAEICLVDQGFVKDEKRSVAQAAKDVGKEVGGEIEVSDFVYYMVGEEV
jgi:elongation factor Ts